MLMLSIPDGAIYNLYLDAETANNNTKRGGKKCADPRALSLAHAHRLVLSESAEHHLPLSNGALFDLLRRAGERAERGVAPDEETARAVRQARRDISVRKNGLDPRYAKFLSTVDVSSGVACLLSIL